MAEQGPSGNGPDEPRQKDTIAEQAISYGRLTGEGASVWLL